jgi:hypothetical protein
MAQHSITLMKTQEIRLSQLYETKCDENGGMELQQFLSFAIERQMITNKFSIECFFTIFKSACGEDFDPVKNTGKLDTAKFNYAMVLLSKIMFHNEINPFEAMFHKIFSDKSIYGCAKGCRLPRQDKNTWEVVDQNFSGDTIKMLHVFLEPLKKLFVDFVHYNLNTGKRSVGWKDVEEKNIMMIARSFLKLCRYYYLIPHLLNIEQLNEYMEITLPPVTGGEMDFYKDKILIRAFDEDKNY